MEAIEESVVHSPAVDVIKASTVSDNPAATPNEADDHECHKSNGVVESCNVGQRTDAAVVEAVITEGVDASSDPVNVKDAKNDLSDISESTKDAEQPSSIASDVPSSLEMEAQTAQTMTVPVTELETVVEETQINDCNPTENEVEVTGVIIEDSEKIYHGDEIQTEEFIVAVGNMVSSNDNVTFKTEVLVEKHDNDTHDMIKARINDNNVTNNMLSELGQNIELSDVLCSSDVTDNSENNNCSLRQEVFNKEELLDILEGKDIESTGGQVIETVHCPNVNALETQMALQQLSRLKKIKSSKSKKRLEKAIRKKSEKKSLEITSIPVVQEKKEDSIVNALVKDWEEDDHLMEDESTKPLEQSESLIKSSEELVKVVDTNTNQEESRTSIDSSTSQLSEGHTSNINKSSDEGQPQRRLGRVIKKKVIFDPDNPDTFTKGKIFSKSKEVHYDKEQPPVKKSKLEQTGQRMQSKSPTKLQWKKPTAKNSKQNKRLTEIDRLLMDEGAVNMIYQLTPEAPRGKKNMKTKAEFIKKLQSSTPDGKEMKFRERRKEIIKSEELEARKIIGAKRSSLSSSVKSPLVCEDFETHSADDSIIYRRHSSSSYSSTCMSPRRLSDVDAGPAQCATRASLQPSDSENLDAENAPKTSDLFMSDTNNLSTEIINKTDCLSIKEKLNSKLSHVLNKKKRETIKTEKQAKQKKVIKRDKELCSENKEELAIFKFLTINFDHRLAEICVRETGSSYGVETLKELQRALAYVDSKKDISVTLLTSECGTLCSSLKLSPLLDDNMEKRTNYAYEVAESARCLLCSIQQHSKLLVVGVWGACWGLSLALLGLSDVAVASERSTFALSAEDARTSPPMPGVAVFTARCRPLAHSVINDLVVFGRRFSASEALQNGLVSRKLWHNGFTAQLHVIAKDIASQPTQNVLLKKKLLNLNKNVESESTFLSCMEAERDLLVEYWTSVEGQELIRASLKLE